MSIAGGVDRALLRASALGCEAVQIFVKSNVQWRIPPLRRGEQGRFGAARGACGIGSVFAHSSYLINLASPDPRVRERSVSSLAEELRRAGELGLPFLVLHPGSHGGRGEREGIRMIASGLDGALAAAPGARVKILLETTAGQGTSIGGRAGQLAEIIARCRRRERLGVCFDTCHVFAAGYDIRRRAGYEETMAAFDRAVGLRRVEAFHLNDCRGGLGSRLDRHAHIGKGKLGLAAFSLLLNDPRFAGLPMVLETPKGKGTALDRRNLAALRRLVRAGRRR